MKILKHDVLKHASTFGVIMVTKGGRMRFEIFFLLKITAFNSSRRSWDIPERLRRRGRDTMCPPPPLFEVGLNSTPPA